MRLARRRLTGEILDRLLPDDPRAQASRRDLRRLNALMRQHAIMETLLRTYVTVPPRRLLEIGGGDGRFMLSLAQRLSQRWPDVELMLLDVAGGVAPQTRTGFAALGWTLKVVKADVFTWADAADQRYDAALANLVLHHFDDAQLARLFAAIAPLAPVFAATEPRRAAFPLLASRMVWVIGATDVTRHDAPVSVRAGFRDRELSALWPRTPDVRLTEGRRGLFTHAFAAARPR